MRNVETTPVDVPGHVEVVPLRAAFAVECRACRETVWLYHVAVMKDPDAIRKAVDQHRDCRGA